MLDIFYTLKRMQNDFVKSRKDIQYVKTWLFDLIEFFECFRYMEVW